LVFAPSGAATAARDGLKRFRTDRRGFRAEAEAARARSSVGVTMVCMIAEKSGV